MTTTDHTNINLQKNLRQTQKWTDAPNASKGHESAELVTATPGHLPTTYGQGALIFVSY